MLFQLRRQPHVATLSRSYVQRAGELEVKEGSDFLLFRQCSLAPAFARPTSPLNGPSRRRTPFGGRKRVRGRCTDERSRLPARKERRKEEGKKIVVSLPLLSLVGLRLRVRRGLRSKEEELTKKPVFGTPSEASATHAIRPFAYCTVLYRSLAVRSPVPWREETLRGCSA